jgi:hypothetical protein
MDTGFAKECKDCSHVWVKGGKKVCVYVIEPRLRRFPCFFREHVKPGGFDGQYGSSVSNFVKSSLPEDEDVKKKQQERRKKIGEIDKIILDIPMSSRNNNNI